MRRPNAGRRHLFQNDLLLTGRDGCGNAAPAIHDDTVTKATPEPDPKTR